MCLPTCACGLDYQLVFKTTLLWRLSLQYRDRVMSSMNNSLSLIFNTNAGRFFFLLSKLFVVYSGSEYIYLCNIILPNQNISGTEFSMYKSGYLNVYHSPRGKKLEIIELTVVYRTLCGHLPGTIRKLSMAIL